MLGLGNPGPRYAHTRHNIGFWVLDRLAAQARVAWQADAGWGRAVGERAVLPGPPAIELVKPATFMNRVGRAGLAACERAGVGAERLIAVCDDADLALGRLRVRPSGGAGGHNGLRSLIEAFGTEAFPRVRIGVRGAGRDDADLADYVLEPFEQDERDTASEMADLAAEAVLEITRAGVASAMNRFNGARPAARDLDVG